MKMRLLPVPRIACIVIALMGWWTEAQGASVTVVLPASRGSGNAEVRVPISVKAAQGLGPLQMDLLFDARQLQFVKAAAGSGFGVGLFDSNLVEPGRVRLVMTGDPSKPIQGDGELFAVFFKAMSGAGGKSALNADKVRAWEQTPEALEMRVTVEPGSVSLTSHSIAFWLISAGGIGLVLVGFALVRAVRTQHEVVAPTSSGTASEKPASSGRFCSSCGTPLSPTSKFCASCGQTQLPTNTTTQAAPAPGIPAATAPMAPIATGAVPAGPAAAVPNSAAHPAPATASPATPIQWHYSVGGKTLGPVTESELLKILSSLPPDTMVWNASLPGWEKAFALGLISSPPPPPLPPVLPQVIPPTPPPPLPSPANCPGCTQPVKPGAKFCPSCGQKLAAP